MDERGQASVELLAAVPASCSPRSVCLQLLAAGYSLTLADGAAEAGALALAAGLPPRRAVEAALPGWARDRVEVDVEGGRLTGQPAPAVAARRRSATRSRSSSSAWVQAAGGERAAPG